VRKYNGRDVEKARGGAGGGRKIDPALLQCSLHGGAFFFSFLPLAPLELE